MGQHNMGSTRRREHREALIARDGNQCRHCHREFTAELRPTLDHIRPFSRGGPNMRTNLQLLCGPCNQARGRLSAAG